MILEPIVPFCFTQRPAKISTKIAEYLPSTRKSFAFLCVLPRRTLREALIQKAQIFIYLTSFEYLIPKNNFYPFHIFRSIEDVYPALHGSRLLWGVQLFVVNIFNL